MGSKSYWSKSAECEFFFFFFLKLMQQRGWGIVVLLFQMNFQRIPNKTTIIDWSCYQLCLSLWPGANVKQTMEPYNKVMPCCTAASSLPFSVHKIPNPNFLTPFFSSSWKSHGWLPIKREIFNSFFLQDLVHRTWVLTVPKLKEEKFSASGSFITSTGANGEPILHKVMPSN